jgi:hypothetical protein
VSAREIGRGEAAETVGGFLASAAIFVSGVALVYLPGRLAPAAMVLALVAAAIGGRHSRLAAFALLAAGVAFVVGMTIAVATDRPLF